MKPGLKGILELNKLLTEKKIAYSIHQYSPDALTVFFTLVGARVEVQFFEDDFDYSVFYGNEDVELSADKLFKLIEGHK